MEIIPPTQLPIVGPWISRTGHVIDIIATPCAVDPVIAVQAFWHSFPLMLASLFKPDPVDYLTERFDGPHKKGRRRRFRPAWQFAPSNPVPQGKVGWAFFTGMQIIERIGWYMLVADATTQFAVNWTSMAYQWSGCKVPGNPYCRMTADSDLAFPYGAGTHVFRGWSVNSQSGFFGDVDSIATPAGFQTNVMLNFMAKPAPYPVQQATVTGVQIIDAAHDRLVWEGNPEANPLGDTYFGNLSRDYIPNEGAHDYQVLVTKTAGHFSPQGSMFMVYGGSDRGLSPDP